MVLQIYLKLLPSLFVNQIISPKSPPLSLKLLGQLKIGYALHPNNTYPNFYLISINYKLFY